MTFQQIKSIHKQPAHLSVVPVPEQEAPRFCSLVAHVLGCNRCRVMLWGSDGRIVADESVDLKRKRVSGTPVASLFPSAGPVDAFAHRGRPVRDNNPSAFGAFITDTLISLPFALPDGMTGILTVLDRENGKPFNAGDLNMLEQLCQFYASTYETPARREALRLRSEIKALRKETIRAQERERQCLSRELHDDIGHALTSAILGLDIQRERLPLDDSSRAAFLAARESLTQCADQLHKFSFQLRPIVLQDLGLLPALRSLSRKVVETGALVAEVIVFGEERRLSDDVELTAFRIVQEALTNALKHSQATRVTSKVTFLPDSLEILISDDGVGFSLFGTEKYRDCYGQGIAGMRERAELVGGSIEVISQLNSGTEIWALLPITESNHE